MCATVLWPRWSVTVCCDGPARGCAGDGAVLGVTDVGLAGCAVETEAKARRAEAGVSGMSLRSEVEVLSWGPDRGNPTLMRQGRGPESTGRLGVAVVWRRRASVRAGLEEAVGAWWSRTRVKRRKASFGGVSWLVAAKPDSCWCRGRIGDVIAAKSQRLTPRDLLGSDALGVGRPEEIEG
jgi:hypothetical protein